MDFQRKKILVIGTGISGIAAAKLLDQDAFVTLYDANANLTEQEVRAKLPENFRGEIVIGKLAEEQKKSMDYAVLSPGVPVDSPDVKELCAAGTIILGEVELAYQYSKGKVVAVTGTNGKTTTTALIGEIMKTYYNSVFVVGNIGIPYTEMVQKCQDDSVTVAEMSSFQLETIIDFRPETSVILNITPDHLNRHHTMENYIAAKFNITKNQTKKDVCILNYEDEVLRKEAASLKTEVFWFSSAEKLECGLYLDGENIMYRSGRKETVKNSADMGDISPMHHSSQEETLICNIHELNIIGRHNYENAMAAIAAGIVMGVPIDCIHKALTAFKAVEHRIEYVATKKGVKYYNDSKGTNPDAAIQAVRAMTTKTLLIGGGYDKGSEYGEWIDSFEGKVKYLVLIGQTREKIAETARQKGFKDIVMADSMQEAVRFCAEHAESGETVLLSPCCASWGMFKNYEERGRIFKELVHAL